MNLISRLLTLGEGRKLKKHEAAMAEINAIESTNETLETALMYQGSYAALDGLRHAANDYVWCFNNACVHSTLGYMNPVEFREAGMSL